MRQCLIDFGVVFFLLHLQEARDGHLLVLKVMYHPACVRATKAVVRRRKKTHKEKMFLMIPAGQLMSGTKGHCGDFTESVSDNCSITPVGQRVGEHICERCQLEKF